MTLSKIKSLSLTLILVVAGCIEKDELTFPVRIHLKVCISSPDSTNSEYFYFPKGQIGIQTIGFEGKREDGGDVFFQTNPKMNLLKFEFGVDPKLISEFDIPKGVYNDMKWFITLKRIFWSEEFIEDDNIDSLNIGLTFSGFYRHLDEYDIPLRFIIDDATQFSFRSYDCDGNSRIVLSENKYETILFFDPMYAFSPISRKSIREAEISFERDKYPIIIISSNRNKYLYKSLLSRISESTNALVY